MWNVYDELGIGIPSGILVEGCVVGKLWTTVRANGKKELLSLTIKPEAVDPDDVEMLQDMVLAAVNEVLRQVEETTSAEMGKLTGGLNLPF